MNGHVTEWLDAYLDDELSNARLRKVQVHLEECASCREELEELRRVSQLLQSAPMPEFTPVEQFVGRVTLQLPRGSARVQPKKQSSLIWWLIPVVLLGAWFFIQTVFTLSGMVSMLDAANLLGSASRLFTDGSGQTLWFTATMDLLGGLLGGEQQTALSIANQLSVFTSRAVGQFLWQAVVALLYLAWLGFWWLRRGQQQVDISRLRS